MAGHGVIVREETTKLGTPVVAKTGVPFVIGRAPISAAETPAEVGIPVLCTSFEEAKKKLGYSDNWADYNLCEFMHSHFRLYGMQPVIFVNLLALTDKTSVVASDVNVANHRAELPIEAINNAALVVKAAGGGGGAYAKGTDYDVFYEGEKCIIELLKGGQGYAVSKVNVAYDKLNPAAVTTNKVATGLESIEKCMSRTGIAPDLICAPGYSHNPEVAALMATKAGSINGLFRAKALIDISTESSGGAATYDKVAQVKATNNFTDRNMILCWPMTKLGDKVFHLSTQLAGVLAKTDSENEGVPYESLSNKGLKIDAVVLKNGTVVDLTYPQANTVNEAGVVTAFSFVNGLTSWGNYTACFPAITDVKDYFIPISRMFDFVANTIVKTYWKDVDSTNPRVINSILDGINIWLNGLVGPGYLLGARAEFREEDNPITALMAGKKKFRIFLTPPSPNQELEFVLEYTDEYIAQYFAA